jgi:hypothetical protein
MLTVFSKTTSGMLKLVLGLRINNKLVQVVSVLVSLSMWLKVWFLTLAYGKNSVKRVELILCAHRFIDRD